MMYDSMKSRQDQAHCYLLHLSDVSGHSLSPAVRYPRGTFYCTAEYPCVLWCPAWLYVTVTNPPIVTVPGYLQGTEVGAVQ